MSNQKDNSDALFKNAKKETEKHPDYRGKCFIGGAKYYIASWIRESKNGNKYMSLSFTKADEKNKKEQSHDYFI